MGAKVRISSPSKESLIKATKDALFCSTIILNDDGTVNNALKTLTFYRWRHKKGRYQLIEIK